MTRILLLKSSPRGSASYSSMLADELVARLRELHPDAQVHVRDLAADPLPHVTAEFASGTLTPEEQRSPEQRQALELSDRVLGELQQADIVVLAAAMINFAIPATLKNWIDHVMRVWVAFTYNEQGPLGLLNGKKLYVVAARGSSYADPVQGEWDFQLPYIEKIFQFMGIVDQQHIVVQPTLAGEDIAKAEIEKARAQIAAIGSM
ncbi:MAG: NAD(P)H-dependent oxidoreductase [Planctomycetales bacterium]|nr:NAD(P)H-dependent oxidoreductase [bacterium]UNM09240.1 MAG: NAD(P)H-dependent oxidoreductase [Planctomycetales bacterium]